MFYCVLHCIISSSFFFFFNDTATTEIYTLSLHDALPISENLSRFWFGNDPLNKREPLRLSAGSSRDRNFPRQSVRVLRSEEHTSELQSRLHLVCRLLLEKQNARCAATIARPLPRAAPPAS